MRPALHYLWFTPPIEEEPVAGEITWLEKGFELTDSLVAWGTANEMYVIFDMHGAPGGQGANADISDYDPSKPSLWESEANKAKLVALWYKIAERYADEPWVGGYDLINETNWSFPEGNNSQLRDIYQRITDTIRLVDPNHIIFIEGNWFANDFSGLTPPWDNNMAYSFHKYWSYNTPGSLDYGLWVRDQYNVPVWLGETGENSNTWFTNLIALCEAENVGWSFWPVKKMGTSNVLQVKRHEPYFDIVNYWGGSGSAPSADDAYNAVMQLAANHHIDNCVVQYDVIDAMMRQPFTTDIKPFKEHTLQDIIFASDYALGRNGHAYFDTDTGNYAGSSGSYSAWNNGWSYRNDGVDIEVCSDTDTTNGYQIGFTNPGEFLVYPITNSTAQLVDVEIRAASGVTTGAYVVLEADGKVISDRIYMPFTGGWGNWRTNSANNLLIPEGDLNLKLIFTEGSANLNFIRFKNLRSADQADFLALLAETAEVSNDIHLHLNQVPDQGEIAAGDFTLRVNNQKVDLRSAVTDPSGAFLVLSPSVTLFPGDDLKLSYSGSGLQSGSKSLTFFSNKVVENNLAPFTVLPGKVEAEDFHVNQGFELEDCQDQGGGQNTSFASSGDILEYILDVPTRGTYRLDLRVALQNGNAQVETSVYEDGSFSGNKTITLVQTGGWQNWQTHLCKPAKGQDKTQDQIFVGRVQHELAGFFPAEQLRYPSGETTHTGLSQSGLGKDYHSVSCHRNNPERGGALQPPGTKA